MQLNNVELNFQAAEINDAQALTDLINSVYRGENAKKGWTSEADLLDGIRITVERIKEIIAAPDNVILICILENKIAGCVYLEKRGAICYLGMLSVDVNYQNMKIGRAIMDKSEQYAKEVFGCTEMEMKVIGQRKELIDYYIRRGYSLTGQKEQFVLGKHFGGMKVKDLFFEFLVKPL